jgi:predicted PurR-regulated permease PerM
MSLPSSLPPRDAAEEPRRLEQPVLPFDSRARALTRYALAILAVLLALWVARDFLTAFAWAGLIAISCWPLYRRFAARILGGRAPALSALLFSLLTGLVLLVPLAFATQQIAQGSEAFARSLTDLREHGIAVPPWLAHLPIAGANLDRWWRANLGSPEGFAEWIRGVNLEYLTSWTGVLGGALLYRLFLFMMTVVILFLLLRDGDWLADHALATATRLLGPPGERLVVKIVVATRATVNGTIAASIAKGAVIGIAYVVADVPHPLLFAGLTMALAMVPFGAWVALAAAALIVPLEGGSLLVAAGLAGFGAAVLLIGDNLVLPALIGNAAQLPFLPVLIGIIGGMESFGLIGLFIGPVIMAALLTIWRDWISERRA